MFTVYNKNTKTSQRRRDSVLVVIFEHVALIFSSVSIVGFKQVNDCWDIFYETWILG